MYTRDLLLLEEQKTHIMNKIKLVVPTLTTLDLDRNCYVIFPDAFKLRNYIKYIIEEIFDHKFKYKKYKLDFNFLSSMLFNISKWLFENGMGNAYQSIPYLYILDIEALRNQILNAFHYRLFYTNFIYLFKITKIHDAGLVMRDIQEFLKSNCIYIADMEEQFQLAEV